jgi:hypothetical protein
LSFRQHNETHQTPFDKGEEEEEGWEYNGGDKLVQGTLHVCTELSQRNRLTLLLHDKSKIKGSWLKKIILSIWFKGKWMQLEDIMLHEVSQDQKHKSHMFSLIRGR